MHVSRKEQVSNLRCCFIPRFARVPETCEIRDEGRKSKSENGIPWDNAIRQKIPGHVRREAFCCECRSPVDIRREYRPLAHFSFYLVSSPSHLFSLSALFFSSSFSPPPPPIFSSSGFPWTRKNHSLSRFCTPTIPWVWQELSGIVLPPRSFLHSYTRIQSPLSEVPAFFIIFWTRDSTFITSLANSNNVIRIIHEQLLAS